MNSAQAQRLRGKTALVTGAGHGIGRQIALRFAWEGARVSVLDRDGPAAHATVAAITAGGGVAWAPEPIDVSQPDQVQHAVAQSVEQHGPPHILVNNAAIAGANGPLLDIPYERWQQVIGVNLTGVFVCGQTVARQMVAHGVRGRIVNIGSVNSFAAEAEAAAYVAAKHGVRGLTQAMAVDLAPYGICVTCIAPGPITVARNAELFNGTLADGLQRTVPLGHAGTPDDVAAAALFLASDEAAWITGSSLVVDGGTLAYLRFD